MAKCNIYNIKANLQYNQSISKQRAAEKAEGWLQYQREMA